MAVDGQSEAGPQIVYAGPQQTRRAGRRAPSLSTRQPLLCAALAFSGGILVGSHCWRPASWWLIAGTVFSGSAAYFLKARPRVASLIALSTWFCLGAVNVQVHRRPPIPDISGFTDRSEVVVTAHVIHEGYLRDAGFGGVRQQIDVESEQVQNGSEILREPIHMRIGIFAKESSIAKRGSQAPGSGSAEQVAEPIVLGVSAPEGRPVIYRYGQRLRFLAKLREPHNYGNPGSFDYRSYLQDSGISALGSAKLESVEVLPGLRGNGLEALRSRMHRRILDQIHGLWPEAEAALMDAAVIGEDAFLFRSTRADFQRSGTYHILVVSGMNVSILAFVVFWTLRRLRASELLASLLTIALAVAYAFLTDVGAPVWRATLMMACYLVTRLVYRDRSMLNALGTAALSIMLIDPNSLLGASFQLTFFSVLIVGALAIPVLERSLQPYRHSLRHLEAKELDPSLPAELAQFRVDLRMIARRLARFVGRWLALRSLAGGCAAVLSTGEVLVVSALMQVGLALPMAWYFHRVTVVAVAANALAVPLTELLMPSAVLALGLSFVSSMLAKIPAAVAGWALRGITATVVTLGRLHTADVRVPMPPMWLVAVSVAALAGSMILVRRRALLAWVGILVLTVTAVGITLVHPAPQTRPGVLEMTSIDVGQGDATLLISPHGGTMLVDAGGMPGAGHSNFDIGEDVVSPYLWSRGISHLDIAVVTHGHWDHVGGMRAVLANFHPRELWVGANSPTESLAVVIAYAREQKIAIRSFGTGDEVGYDGIDIRFLAPIKDEQHRRVNDDCLAMKLTFLSSSLLMEGDAEKFVERSIVREDPSADLLKIGHHGSATSTSEELLAAVRPRIGVISVGRQNSYGHPRWEVLRRLADSGVSVYRTDMDGLVTFYLDGKSVIPAPR